MDILTMKQWLMVFFIVDTVLLIFALIFLIEILVMLRKMLAENELVRFLKRLMGQE